MKTKYNLQNVFLVLTCTGLLVIPMVVQAQFTYSDNGDGTCIVTGDTNIPVNGEVDIPGTINGLTVTSIAGSAFAYEYYNSFAIVTIPDSVTSIGSYAFSGCYNLTSVNIGSGLTSISGGAETFLSGCPILTNISVNVSNQVYSSLGGVLFDKAQATLIQFPEGLGGGYTIPNSVTTIGDFAFLECTSPTSVTISTNVTTIGGDAFAYCSGLTSVTIPDSVTSISDQAFLACTSLTNVNIGNGVTAIGNSAFYNCTSLTSVTIGDSVTTIEEEAFGNCTSLTSVNIPNSVTTIMDGAFTVCTSLMSVNIGNGVTTIGEYAFDNCTSLTNVNIGNDVTTIGGEAFYYCPNLTSVTIPDSVTTIGEEAFDYCTSLTSVNIGNGVTTIGEGAFELCTSLTSVTIPDSVTSIGDQAFLDCTSLTNIMVDVSNTAYSSLNGVLFDKAQATLIQFPEGLGGVYTIPNSVTSIGDFAFFSCTGLTSVNIGNGLTSIGVEAFYNCTSLTNVNIGNGVTSIGGEAFFDCISLTSVTFPNNMTSITDYAFAHCNSLSSAYFKGNAPSYDDGTVFSSDSATVYYLPGTIGWGSTFGSVPTALWYFPNPFILNNGPGFGVQTNGFGFTISWATNISVVVEACTNLENSSWSPLATNTLISGTSYFSDPQWTNYPKRFYRLRSP